MNKKNQEIILIDFFREKGFLIEPNSTDLYDIGAIDSFGIIELLSYIEEKFDLSIKPQNLVLDNFRTIDSILDLLNT